MKLNSDTKKDPPLPAGGRAALIYAAAGGLWIVFSGLSANFILGGSHTVRLTAALIVCGLLFVCASAVIIHLVAIRIDLAWKPPTEGEAISTAFFRNFPGMAYRYSPDPDHSFDFISPGAVELTGLPACELSKMQTLSDMVFEEDREAIRAEIVNALAAKLPFKLMYRIRAADGHTKWVWEQGLGIYSPKGELEAIEGFLVDISGRKRIEEALRRSEQLYMALAESISDAIFMVDEDRYIVSVNRAFLDLFGYSREEVIGQTIGMLHPSEESFRDFGELRHQMERGPVRVEWELMKKSGEVFPVEGTFSVIEGAGGKTGGHVGIVRDITERKRVEKELREYREHLEEMVQERTRELREAQAALVQREKLKTLGATAAEVAHEFRNPLVSIGGFARRLQKKHPDSSEAEIILRETERLETILNRLSDYLRPVDMKPSECHVNTILSESVALLAPQLEKKKVTLHMELQDDLPTAHVDPAILTQVFVAMIRNSMGIMDQEKEMTLKTYHGDRNVYVDMTSPVAGNRLLDPELMLLPFEESLKGTGISSTFKLLKEMGGTLSFARHGSKVKFTVSLVKCHEGDHEKPATERQSG
ncbi:MAG: PAS domain S-box protein [Syntrophobacteraceae bacterium]|nr:PAS domain S-box protein [Syntrophobacteraceae bacterium]